MTIIGIEFASRHMNYVVMTGNRSADLRLSTADRLSLDGTRSCDALRAFQTAVQTVFKDVTPTLLAIKHKPEKGALQAGAAALKMEAVVLANAPCEARFISGSRINKCATAPASPINAYHLPAFKAAICAADDR